MKGCFFGVFLYKYFVLNVFFKFFSLIVKWEFKRLDGMVLVVFIN